MQRPDRVAILGEVPRLDPHGSVPADAEPREVFQDRIAKLRTAPPRVDVLYPQQETPARLSRAPLREQRRADVADMQQSGRARREAGDDHAGTR